MKNSKKIFMAFIILVLLTSGWAFLPSLAQTTTTTSTSSLEPSNSSNNNLLQYEWPQYSGDSSFTRLSFGPAPSAPDILWKSNLTGIQSYISAFDGEIFVMAQSNVYALNRETGSIIWNTTVPQAGYWPTIYKIDDTHMVVGNSCLDPATGQILWTSDSFATGGSPFGAGTFSPEEKMFYSKTDWFVNAWNFSDPSQPPTLAWRTYVPGGASEGSTVQYGDGKVFPGTFDSNQMALDAKTGAVLWDTNTKAAMLFSGTYADNKFFRGAAYDNTFYAFDANTGKILWTFNPGTSDGYWCIGSAAAYGMVYELNKDGNLYALNENTGKVIWQYKAQGPLFFPGNPIIADGKIYATVSQRSAYNPSTESYSTSEFACLDAYSGQIIWTLPIEAYSPRESTAIAYGNLYIIPGYVQEEQMNQYTTLNQIWAIGTKDWSIYRHDPQHTGSGQSGPTNLILSWKYTTGGAVVSSPSIAGGIAYFGSQDKNIYAVNIIDGTLVWKFATGDKIESSPAAVNGRVYTGADDGYVYCLNAYDGNLIWKTFVGGDLQISLDAQQNLRSSPAVVGESVYVGALDNKTYCLNINNGNVTWSFQTQGYITSSPAVDKGVVYVLSQEPDSGGLYMLNSATGQLIRRIAIPYQQTTQGTDLMSSPTVADGMIIVASNKKEYFGINATTGDTQWTYRDDAAGEFILCTPAYDNGIVYLLDQFYIVAVNAQTGNKLWLSFLGAEAYVSPSYADGKLYVTSDERGIYVINAADGSKLSYFGTESNSWSSPSIYGGRMYVGDNDWNLYCFADYPTINGNVTLALDSIEVAKGQLVTGCGQLFPGITNANITLTLAAPNGTIINKNLLTSEEGDFTFTFTPELAGAWILTVNWQTTKNYYTSATSEQVNLQVDNAASTPTNTPSATPTQTESPFPSSTVEPSSLVTTTPTTKQKATSISIDYIYVVLFSVVVMAIVSATYVYAKRRKHS